MANTDNWTGFVLDVPSIQYRRGGKADSGDDIFEYKLPYTVPTAPCCARIHPMLYCCDKTCCACVSSKTGQLPFIDVVDQDSGHQLRYRTKQACCRVPRVLTFADGQYVGHLSRTMRCGNRCYTCMEDFGEKPVLQVGLHDDNGNQIARIDRDGRGGCCQCGVSTPMKCSGCCFTCLTCTCAMRPSKPTACCGILDCDPVCCDCCVRGDQTMVSCFDNPICCIGLPMIAPCISCPCPSCEVERLPATGTIRFNDFDVVDSKDKGQSVGKLQALFRGNFPSAYLHAQDTAFKITGHSENSKIGMLLSGLASGMSYNMGKQFPVFGHMEPKDSGTSPGFDGLVVSNLADQIKRMVGLGSDTLLREDLVVDGECLLGEKLSAVQVHGWRLVEIGYSQAAINACGMGCLGSTRAPRAVTSLKMVQDFVKVALESQTGNYGTTFQMKFEMPDQEKAVVKAGQNVFGPVSLTDGFNPPRQGYIDQLEEVALACTCIRYCKFPCNTTQDKAVCCRMPLYARTAGSSKVVPSAWEAVPPPPVVMVGAPREKFMAAVKK